ncbi:MAG: 4-alpha-glucanotransferase [Deltaproteobacteria bacterium]|nr:4-alpha-glucanotransferase [Deltaproteobacteria bacterium]
MLSRSSGVLLPIFSLPSRFGIGDLGPGAFRFVDFLHAAGQRIWQILPLNPTEAASGHSPYHSVSCFAGNPLLISPEVLAAEGLIDLADLQPPGRLPEGRVDYATAETFKRQLLEKACQRFRQGMPDSNYERFCAENAFWIEDYVLFRALSARHENLSWDRWPPKTRSRRPGEIARLREELHDAAENLKIEQYLFYRQWLNLRSYCREKRIQLFGDIPIYVPFHSADVWSHRQLFKLDRFHRPLSVSGVPPDYFSADGQLWGHPVYNWEIHQKTHHDWWIRRLAHQMTVFDVVRIDHFRGLVAYWEVPAGESTAKLGQWVEAPSEDFFSELQRRFVSLPMVAEDLGHITADVRETMQRFGFPGMRVLMFGFSGNPAINANACHNIPEHCVVYTGTHDNNTVRGWFEKEASHSEKRRLAIISGRTVTAREIAWELIRIAMLSPARWSILPVQDLLGLAGAARINTPGQAFGNWVWRMTARQFDALPVNRLLEMTITFGRV